MKILFTEIGSAGVVMDMNSAYSQGTIAQANSYYPSGATFTSMDPLAEQYYHISPYAYCAGDPVNKIDPDGKRIFITGSHAKQARSQIQKRAGRAIKLTLNEDGSLSYKKRRGRNFDFYSQTVASIIDDPRTDIILGTRELYWTSTNHFFVGGAFMGNRVEKGPDGEVTRVITNQEINASVLSRADTYEHKGTSIMHELTESYEGAKIALETGKSSPSADISKEVYDIAHERATSQPLTGEILYDSDGKPTSDKSIAKRAIYYVIPSLDSDEGTIILCYP